MAEAATLNLWLNGCFRAADAEGRDVEGLSRRAQGLLAFLLTQPGQRAERARLADLLWSDRSEEQARGSLRQELSVMRRLLPGTVDASRQHVWLHPDAVVRQAGDGEFLEGFNLPSEAFEDWLREQRSREGRAQSDPVCAVPAPARRHGDRPALAVLAFDPLDASVEPIFADGIVEEVTGALSRGHEFDVIARQSAFALRGSTLGVPDIAARLGCDYLIGGAVRRAGDRVRISV